jgi:DNA-binding CsgD family transcriptional regulator
MLSCDCQNFTQCDRCVLNLLRPHLMQTEVMQTEADTPRCSQIQQLLTQFKHALDQGGVMSLAIDGQVQFMTPQAEKLLSQYGLFQSSHALSDSLHQWFQHQIAQLRSNDDVSHPGLPLCIEQSGRQLIVRFIPDPANAHYLLLLEEREPPFFSIEALELLGLTNREAEVLFWVAQDKSNASIAKGVGCCEGTVRKHLEHIYKKLGAQTRMGAVMVALERLGLLQR